MLRIEISRTAIRFMDRLPGKHRGQIARKIDPLAVDPHPPDSRPLHGYPFLRADQGEYRIIYFVRKDVLDVRLVGKRNDDEVYRQLGRME